MRNPANYFHWPRFRFDHSRDMKLLYFVRLIKDFTFNSTFFFLPIFLFQLAENAPHIFGFEASSGLQRGVVFVAGFYLLSRITTFSLGIWQGKLMVRISPGKSLTIGLLCFLVACLSLVAAQTYVWLLIPTALIWGTHIQFFWTSYYALLADHAVKNHIGQDMGLISFGAKFVQMAAPAIGGLVIVTVGFSSMLVIASLLTLLGSMLAFQIEMQHQSNHLPSWKEFRSWVADAPYQKSIMAYFGRYAHDAGLLIWPLYIYSILGSVDKVGFVYSLSLFLALIMVFVVGFYIDHSKNRRPYYISGGVLSSLWVLRSLVINPLSIALVDSCNHLADSVHWLFFDSADMRRSKGPGVLTYFTYRETVLSAAAVFFWLFVMVVFLLVNHWWLVFALSGFGVLMSLQMREFEA